MTPPLSDIEPAGAVQFEPAQAGPVAAAFGELWPNAEPVNLIDESLYADYIATRVIDENIARRRVENILRGMSAPLDSVTVASGLTVAIAVGTTLGLALRLSRLLLAFACALLACQGPAVAQSIIDEGTRTMHTLREEPHRAAVCVARNLDRHASRYTAQIRQGVEPAGHAVRAQRSLR